MDREKLVNNLRELCMVHGVSGQEQEVVRLLKKKLSGYEGFFIDSFGNVCVHIKGRNMAPSLMLVAHSDEVGGIVSRILPNGLLAFRTVGGIDPDTLPAARVLVGGLKGTVSCVAAHMRAQSGKGELFIDIGAEDVEEAAAMGVSVGDGVTLDTEFAFLGSNRVCSRAIDDRVGCAVLIDVLEGLTDAPLGDLYFAFSVHEETNMSGAHMLAERYRPDCAVAVDTVPINDVYQSAPGLTVGGGPVLQLMDGVQTAFSGNCAHPGVKAALLKVAGNAGIPVQLCADAGSWVTDADSIHRAGTGIPTGYVSVPRRYAHSASEVLDLRDAYAAAALLSELIREMDGISLSFI